MQATYNSDRNSASIFTIPEPQVKIERKFIRWEIFKIVVSLILYLFDISGDVCSAFRYYYSGSIFYCLLTAILIAFSGILMSSCKTKWYAKNEDDHKNLIPPVSKCFRIFCRFCCMWPLARYVDSLQYGRETLRAKKIKDYLKMERCYKQMLITDANTTYLRLVECFFETIPQLLLTFYILALHGSDLFNTRIWQVVSIITSFISLSWTLSKYERSKTEDSNKLQFIILMFAYLLWTCGRVIVLSFTATYNFYLLTISIIVVALPISIQLLYRPTSDEKFSSGKILFYVILAFIHIFVFVDEREKVSSRPQYFYFIFIFLETVVYAFIVLTHGLFHQTPSAALPILNRVAIIIGLVLLVFSFITLEAYYRYQKHLTCKYV